MVVLLSLRRDVLAVPRRKRRLQNAVPSPSPAPALQEPTAGQMSAQTTARRRLEISTGGPARRHPDRAMRDPISGHLPSSFRGFRVVGRDAIVRFDPGL